MIAHGGLWLGLWFGVLRVFGDLRLVSLCGVIFDLQVTGCFGLVGVSMCGWLRICAYIVLWLLIVLVWVGCRV